MSESDTRTMDALGITEETHVVYIYKGHKYQRLSDALAYAEIDRGRRVPDPEPERG